MDPGHLTDEQLSSLIDGDVFEAVRGDLDRHLGECRSCATRLESLQRTVSLVRQLPSVAVPRSFRLTEAEGVGPMAQTVASPRPARGGPIVRPLWLRAAAGLAAALMVVFFLADAVRPDATTLSSATRSAPGAASEAAGGASSGAEPRFAAPVSSERLSADQAEQPAAAIQPLAARNPGVTATPVGPAAIEAPAPSEAASAAQAPTVSPAPPQAAPQAPPPLEDRAQRFAQSSPAQNAASPGPPWLRLATVALAVVAVSLAIASFLIPRTR